MDYSSQSLPQSESDLKNDLTDPDSILFLESMNWNSINCSKKLWNWIFFFSSEVCNYKCLFPTSWFFILTMLTILKFKDRLGNINLLFSSTCMFYRAVRRASLWKRASPWKLSHLWKEWIIGRTCCVSGHRYLPFIITRYNFLPNVFICFCTFKTHRLET